MKKFYRFFWFCIFLGFFSSSLFAEKFVYKYEVGEKYKVLSTVKEDVLVNGIFNHYAEIVNRISYEVSDVKTDDFGGKKGFLEATFMTTEQAYDSTKNVISGNSSFEWGEEYKSEFWRDSLGIYEIAPIYFMPVVRNVPVFPNRDLEIGDTWEAEGQEAYDIRQTFNVSEPLIVPFTASYTYEDTKKIDGRLLHVINVEYSIFYDIPVPKGAPSTYPVSSMGYSNQTIFWDNELGTIDSYEDEFRIILEMQNGDRFEFRGTSRAEYTERLSVVNDETLEKLQEQLKNLDISDTTVTKDDIGITLSIENIQFMPDSAYLMESEKRKLEKIAELLKAFPDNDLLVSGHTALSGTMESCQELSEKRAVAVSEYLQKLGVKDAYHIFTRGFGASKPIGDNSTESGMAKNRRVEITIIN
ncbi:MAG: OmpA family protein [Treponemataceae bacterium]|nr:OmpA family protein [Treponemataceae bacterium]